MFGLEVHSFNNLFRLVALNKFHFDSTFKTSAQKSVSLRQTVRLVIPMIFTNFGRRIIKNYVSALFNKYPNTHANLSTIKIAKETLKSDMILYL